MKLLNQSVKYLSISILLIIGVWGTVLFFNIADEVKENVDEGLENYKRQIIFKAKQDSSFIRQVNLNESFYSIQKLPSNQIYSGLNVFSDTLIKVQDADDVAPRLAPVRMLTTTFTDNQDNYELKILNPMIENEDLIERLFANMVFLYISLIFAIVLINNIVLRRVWKPFYGLLKQIKNFRLEKRNEIPEMQTKTKEFLDLQIAIDTLLNQNIRIYEQQKTFIGNAAHELQTPLAISVNKLELLLEQGDLSDQQAAELVKIMGIIERLTRLNKSLLLLSKIENRQFIEEKDIEFNHLIKQEIESLSDIIDFKKIKVKVIEKGRFLKYMNPSLAHILISNLLRNALYHNTHKGEIKIEITKKQLSIANSGVDHALDADLIYKSFYKESSKNENTGLGLSIVKAIIDISKLSISYNYKKGFHSFLLKK